MMNNSLRRVAVTGMGIVSPLGRGLKYNWEEGLLKSKSGIRPIPNNENYFDASTFPVRFAGIVPHGKAEGEFDVESAVPAKDVKKMDLFIQYAIAAATDAVEDSGWKPEDEEGKCRTGVMIGAGIGGLGTIYKTSKWMVERQTPKVSPFFIPAALINLASGHVSIKYGFKGPNHAVVTACATGTHAIGDAARLIMFGDADVMVAGGAEAAVCPIGVAGFASAKTLSTRNDEPLKASRPWDKGRDGFVIGEGSGILVLEEYEHAKARGAKIYAEVVGYGMSSDAYHITAPAPDGSGGERAMRAALKSAGIAPAEVDYINAHGTSTPVGDMLEFMAVSRVFKDSLATVSMSSTKSATGHLLGAAGAVEAIFSILSIRDQIVPPTLNLEDPEEEAKAMDLVAFAPKKRKVETVLSNSFGFGGTNACVILSKLK
ncbi:MAG: beta-ketoacyl-ACP synthase II [Rickettsiales bacterium]|jgi:3-oxoacyl-[acyl-carrier-protein] synthase II|nr:beta-ketoacyl-ACP synthase II [Rickettsiales bacterium]